MVIFRIWKGMIFGQQNTFFWVWMETTKKIFQSNKAEILLAKIS